ncbi:MAG: hypothetical protein K4304_05330 [Propionicimonas sp.]
MGDSESGAKPLLCSKRLQGLKIAPVVGFTAGFEDHQRDAELFDFHRKALKALPSLTF